MEQKMVELMDELPKLLNQLSEKLGFAGTKIWEWSLLNVQTHIVQSIIVILGFLLFSFAGYKLIKYILKNDLFNDYAFYTVGIITWTIIEINWAIIAFCEIINLPNLFINPEWCAFQNIIEQLSKLK